MNILNVIDVSLLVQKALPAWGKDVPFKLLQGNGGPGAGVTPRASASVMATKKLQFTTMDLLVILQLSTT